LPDLVPADSYYALEKDPLEAWAKLGRQRAALQPKSIPACFVLGFNRKFYMAQHQSGTATRRPFFHSSYFAGEPVLCAGRMVIKKGQLTYIDDASGHYRPRNEHLVYALEALLMHGVPLTWVKVGMTCGEERRRYDAPYFLARRGRVSPQEGVDAPGW